MSDLFGCNSNDLFDPFNSGNLKKEEKGNDYELEHFSCLIEKVEKMIKLLEEEVLGEKIEKNFTTCGVCSHAIPKTVERGYNFESRCSFFILSGISEEKDDENLNFLNTFCWIKKISKESLEIIRRNLVQKQGIFLQKKEEIKKSLSTN
ncbi:hypothetical protein KJ700_02640 [Patescibacteria group bacterium]|nr:hypothetical protein [Patescibacteria group bacterium]